MSHGRRQKSGEWKRPKPSAKLRGSRRHDGWRPKPSGEPRRNKAGKKQKKTHDGEARRGGSRLRARHSR